MKQKPIHSLAEALTNTAMGFIISYVLTLYILPMWGLFPTHGDALGITVIYTVVSFVRGYVVRRLFNGGIK